MIVLLVGPRLLLHRRRVVLLSIGTQLLKFLQHRGLCLIQQLLSILILQSEPVQDILGGVLFYHVRFEFNQLGQIQILDLQLLMVNNLNQASVYKMNRIQPTKS